VNNSGEAIRLRPTQQNSSSGLHLASLRLKARGFHHPRGRILIIPVRSGSEGRRLSRSAERSPPPTLGMGSNTSSGDILRRRTLIFSGSAPNDVCRSHEYRNTTIMACLGKLYALTAASVTVLISSRFFATSSIRGPSNMMFGISVSFQQHSELRSSRLISGEPPELIREPLLILHNKDLLQ